MTVLGPGATCCKGGDAACAVDCDFDKTAEPAIDEPTLVQATTPIGEQLQAQLPDGTPKVDATDRPQTDTAPTGDTK